MGTHAIHEKEALDIAVLIAFVAPLLLALVTAIAG